MVDPAVPDSHGYLDQHSRDPLLIHTLPRRFLGSHGGVEGGDSATCGERNLPLCLPNHRSRSLASNAFVDAPKVSFQPIPCSSLLGMVPGSSSSKKKAKKRKSRKSQR
ncbi:hypothetical protein NL676_035380 [Syzygium grande]|nr:hypothetical protein NL676_035380 [Syzygium grande]